MPETILPASMGSRPDLSVAALRELGMSHQQIARYFQIDVRRSLELEAASVGEAKTAKLRKSMKMCRPCPED